MRDRTLCALSVVALILGLAAAPARAAGQAWAELRSLSIQLVDLNPGDGIAPQIRFDEGFMTAGAFATGPGGLHDCEAQALTEGCSASSTSVFAWSRGEVFPGNPWALNSGYGASVEASAVALKPRGSADAFANAGLAGHWFMLGPGTRLVVSAAASATASVLDAGDIAWVNMSLELMNFYDNSSLDGDGLVIRLDRTGGLIGPGTVHEARTVEVSLDNPGAATAEAVLYASLWATAASQSPVPESGTWALMAMGLLVVVAPRLGRCGVVSTTCTHPDSVVVNPNVDEDAAITLERVHEP